MTATANGHVNDPAHARTIVSLLRRHDAQQGCAACAGGPYYGPESTCPRCGGTGKATKADHDPEEHA